jgi:PLP dependent protein
MYEMTSYQKIAAHVAALARQSGRDPREIQIIAVSKGRSLEEIQSVYAEGCRLFGESRVQEALPKIAQMPQEIGWHLIGTLQKNKVRKALGRFQLIHSVDSVELAKKISELSGEMGKATPILLQVNTSNEPAKHGLSVEEWERSFEAVQALPSLSIDGLMTIGPLVEEEGEVLRSFAALRALNEKLKLRHLSMGMSHDYPLAIREGATLLRIGTAIFC